VVRAAITAALFELGKLVIGLVILLI